MSASQTMAKKSCSDRIQSIINASSPHDDHLNAALQRQLQKYPDLVIYYNRNCVSRYVTPWNFLKITYDFRGCDEPGNTKRVLRSDTPKFEFEEYCIYCGQICNVKRSQAPTPMEASLHVSCH